MCIVRSHISVFPCAIVAFTALPTPCMQFKETSRGPNKYTALPCIHEPNTPHNVPSDVLCTRDTFSIRTQICSTKLTQNGECTITPSLPSPPHFSHPHPPPSLTADLHRLLHWRATKEEKLPSILTAVTKVPGEEIVKVQGNQTQII